MSEIRSDTEESTEERGDRRTADWQLEDQIRLLTFVREVPSLYDRESPAFRDKIIKQDAWNLIGKNLNITGDEACKHFIYLREKYGRMLRARRSGKVGKVAREENFPIATHLEWLKCHIVERRRRQTDEFEQILGSEQNYGDFSFSGSESLVTAGNVGDPTHGKRKSEAMDDNDNHSAVDVQIVESRSLRSSQKDQKTGVSRSAQNTKLLKLDSESDTILNEKLQEILDRGTAGRETSPNYLFGMYVTSKLDKMSPQDASSCTFRIHEILFQTEVGKFSNSLPNSLNAFNSNAQNRNN